MSWLMEIDWLRDRLLVTFTCGVNALPANRRPLQLQVLVTPAGMSSSMYQKVRHRDGHLTISLRKFATKSFFGTITIFTILQNFTITHLTKCQSWCAFCHSQCDDWQAMETDELKGRRRVNLQDSTMTTQHASKTGHQIEHLLWKSLNQDGCRKYVRTRTYMYTVSLSLSLFPSSLSMFSPRPPPRAITLTLCLSLSLSLSPFSFSFSFSLVQILGSLRATIR